MPSTRKLAENLGISRTTVVLTYEKLVEGGFLAPHQRSSYQVAWDAKVAKAPSAVIASIDKVDWQRRLDTRLSAQRNIVKPQNWQEYKYPFVYGQPDSSLFPLGDWRECSRQAMSQMDMRDWANDAFMQDDPQLVTEIRTKILPERGIFAGDDEILITLGAQNGLYLIAAALVKAGMRVGVEDPGYPDVRNIFDWHGAELVPLAVDSDGVVVDTPALGTCSLIYVTPSHHYPTTVTLSNARRRQLLQMAADTDQLIIEDDFESETNYTQTPIPSLKSLDGEGRVIHVGSLSKSMFPGLRLGYVVAPRPLIQEMRLLRRLMFRHVPSNNQRTTSLFIALGYHISYVRQLNKIYAERWRIMQEALGRHLPGMATAPQFGGTSFWIRGPATLDADELAGRALLAGIVLEPGPVLFMNPVHGKRYFRLGFSSISTDRIESGLKILSSLLTP